MFVNLQAQNEEEIVKDIREKFTTVNTNLKSYEVKEYDLSGESTEGGALTAYSVDGNIVLLRAKYFGEMGNTTEEYYFYNNELYFSYWLTENYDMPVYMADAKVISKDEDRYYFNKQKMIRWLGKDKVKKDKNSQKFKDFEKIVLENADKLKAKLGGE
jgi:hypothetical protein